MRVLATNSGKMSSDELFRRLLTGDISQDELEKNPDLVTLAMRIYGREALEDLGVKITQLETPEVLPKKYDFDDIELPQTNLEPQKHQNYESGKNLSLSFVSSTKQALSSSKTRKILLLGLAIRLFLAPWTSHSTDVATHFLGVSDMIQNSSSPYASLDYSYPPVFIITLYPVFWIASLFSDPGTWASTPGEMDNLCADVAICTTIVPSSTFIFFMKIPLIISDVLAGLVIYSIIHHIRGANMARKGMAIYLLNPLTIWVSSVLGQSDSMLAMFVLFSIYYLAKDELIPSGIMFGLSVMTKGYSLPLAVYIGTFAVLFSSQLTRSGPSFGKKEVYSGMKIGFSSLFVAISLTLPMLTLGGGGVIFSRQIQRPFRPGGVSPFSLTRFDFVPTEEINQGGTALSAVELLHNIGLEYFIGIIVAFYMYKRTSEKGFTRFQSLILGCTTHIYFLIFLLGSVNAQYLVVLVGMLSISCFLVEQSERPMRYLTFGTIFAALFGISIVTFSYDLIPLAANTDILELDKLIDSILTQWNSPGILTSKAREDRSSLFGFFSWLFITACFTSVFYGMIKTGRKTDV